jgi:hypothetical protein
MSVQLTLNLSIDFVPRNDDTRSDYDERFAAFHRANPEVYDELRRLARDAKARGHRKLGVRMLWEVLRWNELDRATREFKLDNNFHSRYARLLDNEPDLGGLFDFRELRS